jgi:hypothetical protein
MSGQLHFELDASVKLFTEFTTLAASLVRAPTDDVTALAAKGSGTRTRAPPWRARDIPGRAFILIVYRLLPATGGYVIALTG